MHLQSFTTLLASLSVSLLATSAAAQIGLSINGGTSVVRPLGGDFELSVTGPVGTEVALLVDADPGPVMLFGQSFPIGFTTAAFGVPLGVIPASGTLTASGRLPREGMLHGESIYFGAFAFEAGNGFTVSNGASVTLAARPELAGNSLAVFPFFETVLAINRGSSVELAVDPRYPAVDGVTIDAWVVESRTATEWGANTTLVDARGAPQSIAFPGAGSSIQTRTFTLDTGALPGPDESPGSGDLRIGVGYDVVLDLNGNGVFDDGVDMIDGFDEEEAGFYIVRDTVAGGTKFAPGNGPYAVTEVQYSLGGAFMSQDTYFPTNIGSLGQLPLVVISHGNGHDYRWYDHFGYHLASYGYVVMSHQNNTVPGSHTAAISTLQNTDSFLANLTTIASGALNGHIDSNTIIWIGHSRGADGVARAYDQLFRNVFTPTNYTIDDIQLVSSIAPVDFGGFEGAAVILGGTNNGSHPHDANFHLWVAQADADVHGCADNSAVGWYHLHDRATQARQSVSLYGVGHGDYHDGGGGSVASGPSLIGRTATHDIVRGYVLPLLEHHIHGDVPSRDFLWRQYESFRPVGVPASRVVNLMFQDAPTAENKFIIDDFQNQAFVNPTVGTSGAAVTIDVADFIEGRAADANTTFSNTVLDPFNGFTHDDLRNGGEFRSNSFACVFSFNGVDRSLTYDLTTIGSRPNLDDYRFLSFRAAQGTRHPLTTAATGDLTFTVTLEDASGTRSSINIGAYGGGCEEPYARNTGPSCGAGFGWTSEYETIRVRLRDFESDGSDLDLSNVTKLIFEFGPSFGSDQGRIGLDEIELTTR